MLKRAVRDQLVEMLDTLREGVQYAQSARVFMAKKVFFDSIESLESIMAAVKNGLSPERYGEYKEIFAHLLAMFHASKVNEGELMLRLLIQLTKMLKIEKEICKEILFLPYKASMWDSLESIWRAAAEDPECEAYVMPIPYCDREPDGSAGKWHYEGDLYPEDVPVTSFEAYDIAKRRPDIIYFHNPYDDYNRVTSVHPAYYSEKLKKHTKMLVYVPYFVTDGKGVSDHFCETPGVMNADIVVVQSEKVKETYAKFIPAEKILALGSPKFDKVAEMARHRPPMPEEWQKIAKGRKLILYNTHLTPLMLDDGSVCRKLRYVFSCFEGRDDVCLLWRPHPLSEATMQAMNSKPLAEYHRLVEEYKRKKIGIFDDSSDVHRAIALSDAYYGDRSSLISLYGITGKPLMVQNMEIFKNTISKFVFEDAVFDNDVAWFSPLYLDGLFSLNLKTKEFSYVGEFLPNAKHTSLYRRAIKVGRKLYFIPFAADAIAEFDIDKLSFTMHDLPLGKPQYARFQFAFLESDWLWLVPMTYHSFVKFNIVSGEVKLYSDWYESLKPYIVNNEGILFNKAVKVGKYVWCPFYQGNLVVKINLLNGKMKVYQVGNKAFSYKSLAYDGKNFWMTLTDKAILVKWNEESNQINIYRIFSEEYRERNTCFGACIYVDGLLWLFPTVGNLIVKFDIVTEQFLEYDSYPDQFAYVDEHCSLGQMYAEVNEENGIVNAFPMRGNMLLRIESATDLTEGIDVSIPKKIKDKIFYQKYILREEYTFISILYYIDYIAEGKNNINNERKNYFMEVTGAHTQNCGEKINAVILENVR